MSDASGSSMRGGKFKPLISIAVVLFLVTGLYFVVHAMPMDALGEVRAKRLVWWAIPLIALLQIGFLVLVAEVWRRLVQVLTGTRVTLWSSYLQLAVLSIGKYVPGKVWGFVARAGEMRRQKIPVHLSAMTTVVEQVLIIASALLVALAAAFVVLHEHRIVILAGGAAVLLATVIVTIKVPVLTRWVLRRRDEQNVPDELPGYQATSIVGFSLAYAVLWLLSGAIFSVIFFSLINQPASGESVAALILSNTIGIVAGFAAVFAPGGIGVREAVTTGVLAEFLPIREALLAAVAYRAWIVLIDGANAILLMVREARP